MKKVIGMVLLFVILIQFSCVSFFAKDFESDYKYICSDGVKSKISQSVVLMGQNVKSQRTINLDNDIEFIFNCEVLSEDKLQTAPLYTKTARVTGSFYKNNNCDDKKVILENSLEAKFYYDKTHSPVVLLSDGNVSCLGNIMEKKNWEIDPGYEILVSSDSCTVSGSWYLYQRQGIMRKWNYFSGLHVDMVCMSDGTIVFNSI